MGAESVFAGRFAQIQPDPGLEPLSALVQQAHQGDGSLENVGCEGGDFVENSLWRGIHQPVIVESLKTRGFVDWQWIAHHVGGQTAGVLSVEIRCDSKPPEPGC